MYKEVTECRACGGNDLELVLDLGAQPLANSYHKEGETLPEYPLALNVCKNCFHCQLTVVVDPDELFRNYLYVSGTSQTLKAYFDWFARYYSEDVPRLTNKVLDIACNDGSQLNSFKSLGWDTYGVDPAENIVPTAMASGHKVICDYWTSEVAKNFLTTFDIITAQNVFAHTDDILSFLLACKEVMHEDTKLLIQTSQANMILNGEFDTIYHEHLSFFNTDSMRAICERAGLSLNKVKKTSVHGMSYVFEIGLISDHIIDLCNGDGAIAITQFEREKGLYDLQTYLEFGLKAEETILALKNTVDNFYQVGYTVIGAGAAAKFMTVLNAGKVNLDFIIDEAPLKQGLLTPGMNIPIYGFERLSGTNSNLPLYIVVGAWNFKDEIMRKVKLYTKNNPVEFITYFPHLQFSS